MRWHFAVGFPRKIVLAPLICDLGITQECNPEVQLGYILLLINNRKSYMGNPIIPPAIGQILNDDQLLHLLCGANSVLNANWMSYTIICGWALSSAAPVFFILTFQIFIYKVFSDTCCHPSSQLSLKLLGQFYAANMSRLVLNSAKKVFFNFTKVFLFSNL